MEKLQTLVVGAGVVGLAIARVLALKGHEVIVAEKETHFGAGTSARNSGVIHAGIYYPAGSMKAQLCVDGKKRLYAYAKERSIPNENCQKLIVACDEADQAKLESIMKRARANGVDDLRLLTATEAVSLEPEVSCTAALLSPSTGIVDIHRLMEEFIIEIEQAGGTLAYQNEIATADSTDQGIEVTLSSGECLLVENLINAAGIGAQRVSGRIKDLSIKTIPKQYLAKGNYFGVSGKAPFERLVYPVPVQGGLGAHFTKNIAGESLFGPDVEWLEDGQALDYIVDPGRVSTFYASVKRFWPGVEDRELIPAYAGIRPKLSGPGMPDGDFIIQDARDHGVKGLINLYGIESPGLTASMGIADFIVQRL